MNGYGIVAFMPMGREKPRDYNSNDMHKMSRSFVSPTPSLKILVVVSAMAMTLDKSQIPLGVVDEQNGDAEALDGGPLVADPNGGGPPILHPANVSFEAT